MWLVPQPGRSGDPHKIASYTSDPLLWADTATVAGLLRDYSVTLT